MFVSKDWLFDFLHKGRDQKVTWVFARSFFWVFYNNDDCDNQSHSYNDGKNHTDPLSGWLLMSLSLNYLFVGLHDVFLNDLHVLVGPDQLGALLGGVLL